MGSNSDKVRAFECALDFRYEFDPRSELAIRFDCRGHSGPFFGLLPGLIVVTLLSCTPRV